MRRAPNSLLSRSAALILAALTPVSGCGGEGPERVAAHDPLADRGYARTERLVTTEWIAAHLDDPTVLLVDLRSAEVYRQGHIPGAVHLPPGDAFQVEDDRGVPAMLPARAALAGTLGAIGATPQTTIVFYDDRQSLHASRALWSLAVYRHADARILDGGWIKWVDEDRATTTEIPARMTMSYAFIGEPDRSIVASWDEIVAAIDDPAKLVCDARSSEEYDGMDVRAARGGHVPGAVNVEWSRAVGPTGEFRPAAELSTLYADAGVTSGKTTYTMCQSGVRAAHTWFVLTDLLGYEDVRVYDGSWIEYGNREDVPIEDPSSPSTSTTTRGG